MDLPTSREIELETLLRQRDAQVAELTDEVTHLRQYLSTQPAPSTTDPISLPPALISLLLPHISDRTPATPTSSTVTAALTQRAKALQEENDELYELLKTGETGKLKEDVRALRLVVQKLEGALRDSHQVIASISAELDKAHETILAHGRQAVVANAYAQVQAPMPRKMYQPPPHLSPVVNGSGKPVPTGPRAHKKPRLSESHTPPAQSKSAPSNSSVRNDSRERRPSLDRKPSITSMDVDEDRRSKPRSPERERERDRARDKNRNRERDREREPVRDRVRDRDRGRDKNRDRVRERERERNRDQSSKRNGAHGGNGGGGGGGGGGGRRGRGTNNASTIIGDRTLAERMGL
ncbi:hypothetical protein B0H21DRAFT_705401 [Amylocystis lapponica]|nr:hypothetical protein B0H21DRAFT_705401 [Amylocystis lapponica]